jgi:23S rRNA (adenine2503-C2)-methyltransferase
VGSGIVGMELAEIETALGAGEPKFRARQIYEAVYRRRVTDLAAVSNIPRTLRERLGDRLPLGLPEIERFYDSIDGTRRYLLRMANGKTQAHSESVVRASTIEAVWMPEEDRSTVCISTQAGCAVGCKFCLTALLGLERNLTAGEIVGQVLLVAADQGLEANVDRLNIVMMGQGEPLLNLASVLKATRLLTDPEGMAISPRRITVSTSGITPKIAELGLAPVRPRLAISLNASNEEQRRELMPITRKYPLKELIAACGAYPLRPWEKLTFEYVLLKGVNDTDADARRVVRLLGNLPAKVNLIALNPGPGIPFETPEPGRVAAFQAVVRNSLPCFIRKPRGLDVFAACGQLKRMELVALPA